MTTADNNDVGKKNQDCHMYIDMKKSAHISPSLFWGGLTCFSNQLYCIVKIISMITLISLVSIDNHISANLPLTVFNR